MDKADKATTEEAIAGMNDTHYMTPKTVKEALPKGILMNDGTVIPAKIFPGNSMMAAYFEPFKFLNLAIKMSYSATPTNVPNYNYSYLGTYTKLLTDAKCIEYEPGKIFYVGYVEYGVKWQYSSNHYYGWSRGNILFLKSTFANKPTKTVNASASCTVVSDSNLPYVAPNNGVNTDESVEHIYISNVRTIPISWLGTRCSTKWQSYILVNIVYNANNYSSFGYSISDTIILPSNLSKIVLTDTTRCLFNNDKVYLTDSRVINVSSLSSSTIYDTNNTLQGTVNVSDFVTNTSNIWVSGNKLYSLSIINNKLNLGVLDAISKINTPHVINVDTPRTDLVLLGITVNDQYAYFVVAINKTYQLYKKVLRVDMSNLTSNWSEVIASSIINIETMYGVTTTTPIAQKAFQNYIVTYKNTIYSKCIGYDMLSYFDKNTLNLSFRMVHTEPGVLYGRMPNDDYRPNPLHERILDDDSGIFITTDYDARLSGVGNYKYYYTYGINLNTFTAVPLISTYQSVGNTRYGVSKSVSATPIEYGESINNLIVMTYGTSTKNYMLFNTKIGSNLQLSDDVQHDGTSKTINKVNFQSISASVPNKNYKMIVTT